MKEQVKEWIVDKNLTTDSFDSIMIGVIYNSGHSTLDDPDVRKWIETHPNEFRLMLPPKLTDDQQVLLDELKVDQNGWYPFFTIWHLMEEIDSIHMPTKEQFQVLAAFAEWGMANE